MTSTAIEGIRRALRRLAAHPPTPAEVARARRDDVASAVFGRDALTDQADYFGGNIALLRMDPRRGEADTARVSAADVAAVLREWAKPVGFGIATAAPPSITQGAKPERRERLEHVPPAMDEPDVEPSWTRLAPRGIRAGDAPAVDTFALPNGLRVFVEPRHGTGTVYVRAGLGSRERIRDPDAKSVARLARIVAQHEIVLDDGAGFGMHAYARELPAMLRVIAELWVPASRAPGRSRPPRPEHAWIALTGDVDPLAVRARTTELFGAWHVSASPEPSPSRPRPHRRGPRRRRTSGCRNR